MHKLGHTRSTNQRDHLLHTPDTFVRTVLPGMERASAVVHISPAAGAAFTQYTAELEPGGSRARSTMGPGHASSNPACWSWAWMRATHPSVIRRQAVRRRLVAVEQMHGLDASAHQRIGDE